MNWTLKIVGFLVGASIGIVVWLVLLSDCQWKLRESVYGELEASARLWEFFEGPGLLFIPLALGCIVSGASGFIRKRIQTGEFTTANKFISAPLYVRAAIVFPVFWILCVGVYVAIFEPYGSPYSNDLTHMLKVILFPAFVILIGSLLYWKLVGIDSSGPKTDRAADIDIRDKEERG